MTYCIEFTDGDKEYLESDVELSETEILNILQEKYDYLALDYADFDYWEV